MDDVSRGTEHVHHRDGPEDCYGCKVRGLVIGLPKDLPSRTYSKTPPRTPQNNWEKGVARDERGMPIIRPDLSEVGVKAFAEERHTIEENRRKLESVPPPAWARK